LEDEMAEAKDPRRGYKSVSLNTMAIAMLKSWISEQDPELSLSDAMLALVEIGSLRSDGGFRNWLHGLLARARTSTALRGYGKLLDAKDSNQ
jgi:hypothetical protein